MKTPSMSINEWYDIYDEYEESYYANNSGLTEFLHEVTVLDENTGSNYAETVYKAIDAVILANVQKFTGEKYERY